MPETPLPSRQWFRDHAGVMLNDDDDGEEWEIVVAYVANELKTEAEWREAIDEWFLICKHHGARQLTDPSLVDRCNVWWWMNEADSARTSDEPPCVFVDAALGER